MMRKNTWLRFAAVLVLASMLMMAGCGTGSAPTSAPSSAPGTSQQQPAAAAGTGAQQPQAAPAANEPQRGGVLRVVEPAPGGPFGVPWEIVSMAVVAALPAFETLLSIDADGKVLPNLAEDWKVDTNEPSVTLFLRKGVKFHDGSDFNAETVRFNLQWQMDTKKTPQYKSLEVIDEHTIKIHLNEWDNTVMLLLAGTQSLQMSKVAYETMGDDKAKWHPVGTGPFEFVSQDRDVVVKYKRFDGYWEKGKPYLDRLEMHFIQDQQTQKAALMAGQVDVVGAEAGQMAREMMDAGFPAISGNSGTLVLWPSGAKADSPFKDVKVRQAASLAVDRAALAKALSYGLGEPINQFCSKGLSCFIEDYEKDSGYDPARAKALLAEAGYPNGFKTRLIPAPFVNRDTSQAVQRYLAEVGIQAEIELPDQAKYFELQRSGWDGLLLQPAGRFPNYNRVLTWYFWGPAVWSSVLRPDGLKELYDKSRQTVEPEVGLTQRINRLLQENQAVIPLYASPRVYLTQKNVHGTGHMQFGSWPYWTPQNAWLSK